jgi:23S rRNA (cytosine1962-C5)-methyltransferase
MEDERGKFQGSALYSSSSQIALRKISDQPLRSGQELLELLRQRVRQAVAYRTNLAIAPESNAYRVVFSEGDALPGLIADRYNDVLSYQALTQAMDRADIKQVLVGEMMSLLANDGVARAVERCDARIRELEALPLRPDAMLHGDQTATIYTLNGLRFHYDAVGGQKTGAFLDQRENYAAAATYAQGKRKALDVFCYHGGFALHLAQCCSSVVAVDSSRPALEVAEKNETLNRASGGNEIEWIEANAFDLLKDYSAAGEQYDIIVLDPPAFAKSKRVLETAARGYKELNLRAIKMLRPGGILVTCSCSYHLNELDFLAILSSASADAQRNLRLIEQRTQSRDHPVVLGIPETKYLKCVVLQTL